MNRSDVKELYYIIHIDNLESILQRGIMCYNQAKKLKCKTIADEEIQKRREKVVIPGGKHKLHDYANLYFNARNPMMFKRKDEHKNLCILRINSSILDEPAVIISDKNASSGYVRFYSLKDLDKLDANLIFAEDWRNGNTLQYWIKKSTTCAEVLVPDTVASKFIKGVYVSCKESYQKVCNLLKETPFANTMKVNPTLFFQEV